MERLRRSVPHLYQQWRPNAELFIQSLSPAAVSAVLAEGHRNAAVYRSHRPWPGAQRQKQGAARPRRLINQLKWCAANRVSCG